MEPVELDFIYGGNTETEGAKIIKTTEEISAAHKQAKSDIERHQVAIVNLKKDLVELGVSYKRATTKEGKSEILTEIELTKKNIIDETAAIKTLKAEITALNKMPKTSVMPDANNIAKTAMGYNSLNMSVQQVVRELPAASMGLNMFFLAIGNNIPILTDNIKRARLENEALKASDASTTPVWKQLLSSLTSWQSLMMVGITVATMYGKEIFQAFSKGSEAAERAKESTKRFNDSFAQSAAEPLAKLNQLSDRWNKLGDNLEEKKKFVDSNKDAFRELGIEVKNVSDAENVLVKNVDAFRQSMIAKAMAVAAMAVASEKYQEYFKKMREVEAMSDTVTTRNVIGGQGQFGGAYTEAQVKNSSKIKAKAVADAIKAEGDALIKESNVQNERYVDFLKKANIKIAETSGNKSDKKQPTIFGQPIDVQVEQQLQSIRLGITKDAEKRRADFMKQSQKAQKLDNDKMLADMKKANTEAERIIQQTGDERTRIEKEYADRIKTLREAGRFDAIAEVEKERDAKISATTRGMIEETDLYKLLSDDKINIAKETTQALLEELKKRIETEIAAGKLSVEAGNKMLADVGKAQATAQGDKNKNNPFAQLGAAIGNNTDAQKAFKTAPAGTSATELAKLESAANKARKSMAEAAAESLNGVNEILGSVVGGLDQLGLLNEQQKKDAENVMGMLNGAANLAKGIATGNPIDIVKGSVELLVNAIEFFDFKNKALEKSQRAHMKNVDELELKYKKLQRAVETALGTDVYKAQREQIDNNKKQIAEYEAWLALEMQKKKRKQDQDKIAETKAKIDELNASNKDIAKALTESIAQTNVKDLAAQLSDALVNAFQNGENAAEAMGNVVDNVLRNAVINALKLQVLDKLLSPAIDQFAIDMESNGGLSDSEASKFKKAVTGAGELYFKALNEANDALGGIFTGESSGGGKTGIKGDIAKMTEETGSALVGQITAMRLNVSALLANSKSSLDTVGKVLATLELIKTNTDRLNRIDETLYYIKLNGVKVL